MTVYEIHAEHLTRRDNRPIMQTLRLRIIADDDCLMLGDSLTIIGLKKP